MNFQLPPGKWIVCQIYFRRSKQCGPPFHDRSYFFPSILSLSLSVHLSVLSFFLSPRLWNCTIGSGNWNVRPCSSCRCVQSWKWFISNGTGGTAGIENSMASSASFRLNQSSWSFRCYLSRTFKYPTKYFRSWEKKKKKKNWGGYDGNSIRHSQKMKDRNVVWIIITIFEEISLVWLLGYLEDGGWKCEWIIRILKTKFYRYQVLNYFYRLFWYLEE